MLPQSFTFEPTYHGSDGRAWLTRSHVHVSSAGQVEVQATMTERFPGVGRRAFTDAPGGIATRTTEAGTRTYQYVPHVRTRPLPGLWRRTVREAAQDAASHIIGMLGHYGHDTEGV